MTTFLWTIATDDYCMLQISITSISCIDYNIVTCRAAIAARNAMTTECSDIINYNNSNNNYALITADRHTDRLTL